MRTIEEFVGRNPALRPLLRQMHQQVGGAWGWGMHLGLQPLPQRA